ncbi:MAG: ABC transporter permease subunit [Chloroflexi bacterium]|nr:ABC transporter permease subunit [Chloroflexota bacterium]
MTTTDARLARTDVLPRGHRPRWLAVRRVTDLLMHAYIILWLLIFVLPFLALLDYSLQKGRGYDPIGNFSYVFFGSFKDNLLLSLQVTVATIVLNTLIAIPAAYGIVRYNFPGKRGILALLNLPLYTPAAVIGLGLLLVYNLLYHIEQSTIGLIAAMTMGTFALALMPIIVSLKDLPPAFEEASLCLGATKWQTFVRIVLPLIGPGISAGVLLTFVIVFNEFLVTLFIAGPGQQTAPLRVYSLIRSAGIANTTAALAVAMQAISFLLIVLYFRIVGARYLRGTYMM